MQGLVVVWVFLLFAATAFGQMRSVAITIDDLPYAGGGASETLSIARMVNGRLLDALQAQHVPATGFVIQKAVESLGAAAGPRILQEWTRRGFDLGNHTYSHPDINELSVEQVKQEIVRGEAVIGSLMKQSGKKLAYFRFPMNHTGENKEKRGTIAAFLSQRGYRVATCTIDNSDYLFNSAYVRMLANKDEGSAERLRGEYLAYTSTEIDYYAGLNRQVFGYEPPQVMLLHDNRLNADVIEEILQIFAAKQYRFVSLDAAQADPAYRTPETFLTRFGPMWGYRWAKERHVQVNGSLEQEPPKWILDYGKAERVVTR